mmetsp:Transcript_8288/g.17177  ORF Transcript_8288/g.17177 Transcript_8288/m.17177 type:complete len:251 (+) Transcript_8288:765-1517(+)
MYFAPLYVSNPVAPLVISHRSLQIARSHAPSQPNVGPKAAGGACWLGLGLVSSCFVGTLGLVVRLFLFSQGLFHFPLKLLPQPHVRRKRFHQLASSGGLEDDHLVIKVSRSRCDAVGGTRHSVSSHFSLPLLAGKSVVDQSRSVGCSFSMTCLVGSATGGIGGGLPFAGIAAYRAYRIGYLELRGAVSLAQVYKRGRVVDSLNGSLHHLVLGRQASVLGGSAGCLGRRGGSFAAAGVRRGRVAVAVVCQK